ncbi:MAG: PAS domain S-box protein [Desulfobulbaceae bacterium]|nr:PAS domain S-box protein [Desulfobulbaceae bacterium]
MTNSTVVVYSEALEADGKALFDAFIDLAEDAGYGKYLQTHAADWQKTVIELIPILINYLGRDDAHDSIFPEEYFSAGSPGDLGRISAGIFESHGITFNHCLGMIKLLRPPFLDMAHAVCGGGSGEYAIISVISHVLDKFEFGFAAEWHRLELLHSNRELRAAKHYILHEKRRYYTIFHRMVEPAFVVDDRSLLCDVNHAFEVFFGKKGRDIIGRHCKEVLDAGLCEACDLDNVIVGKSSFSGVEITLEVGGKRKTGLLSGTFLGGYGGESPMSIIVFQDITEKKQIEQALVESEEKFRSLIENMPDVTWRADNDGKFLFISPNLKKVCGYSPAELYRRGRFRDIHEEDVESVRDAYGALFLHQRQFDIRYRFRCKNGNWIWLHDRAVVVTEKEGSRYADGIFADITELKRVEDELERHHNKLEELVEARTAELIHSNELLKQEVSERRQVEEELRHLTQSLARSNTDLEQFAHVVSHDLREPLMLIVAFTERLLQRYDSELNGRGLEYLQRVYRSARRLEQMVDELLQLSRISSQGLNVEPFALSDLMAEVVDNLEERIRQVQGRVKIGILQDIEGDRLMMGQLFQNVICNALKYRKEGVEPLVVVEGREVNNDFIEVTVEDNGIGFDEKYLDRIFAPFERLEAGSKYEGTGIGLATCEKIVVHHGGMITARSQPGVGTTFVIRLPRRHHVHK